jgi:hypothetical protein
LSWCLGALRCLGLSRVRLSRVLVCLCGLGGLGRLGRLDRLDRLEVGWGVGEVAFESARVKVFECGRVKGFGFGYVTMFGFEHWFVG